MDRGIGERVPGGVCCRVRARECRIVGRGDGALSMVFLAPALRHRPEVRAADQARAVGSRARHRHGPSAALPGGGRGAAIGARGDSRAAGPPAGSFRVRAGWSQWRRQEGSSYRGRQAGRPFGEAAFRVTDHISRRDALKVLGAASASALVPPRLLDDASRAPVETPLVRHAGGEILPLTSTTDVFVPPRGRAFMKFSFDFPEPSVVFGDLRFGFLVFTDENTYGLDRGALTAEGTADEMRLTGTRFVWAGGQETAPGRLTATFRRRGTTIEWDVVVEMDRPVKTVTTIVRGLPRGQISLSGGGLFDPRDNEILGGYTFGAGDLHGPGSAQG